MSEARRFTRRSTLKLAGAGALAAVAASAGGRLVLAQEATPTAGAGGESFAGLGLPELTITITDDAFEGLESQVAPGTYLVHATSEASQPSFLTFMQLPEGMTSNDLVTMLGGAAGEGGADATPAAEGAEGEEELGALPEWYYTVHIAGGAGVGPGESAHFVIALQPGNYIVWGEDPSAPQTPVDLTVDGDPAAEGATPEADVTILEVATADGFAFEYEGDFVAGTQVVAVTNNSDQPHFVEFARLPAGTTRDDVDAMFQGSMTGTPSAGGLTEEDFELVYFVGTQSAGTTQWHEVTLDAGTYFVACWVPDPARGGIPHAMEGMYDVVTIDGGDGDDAEATPAG